MQLACNPTASGSNASPASSDSTAGDRVRLGGSESPATTVERDGLIRSSSLTSVSGPSSGGSPGKGKGKEEVQDAVRRDGETGVEGLLLFAPRAYTDCNSPTPDPHTTESFPPPLHPSQHSIVSGTTTFPTLTFNSLASSRRPILEPTTGTNMSGLSGGDTLGLDKGRQKRDIVKTRLDVLGDQGELTRTFDFWASWGMGMSNIGFLPGTCLGVLTAMQAGGGSMYSIAWPLTGLFFCTLAAVLGEMASAYPVAGAMFTWVFRLCRSSRRLDPWARYLSWVTGSYLLCFHILVQIVIAYQLAQTIQGVWGLYSYPFEVSFGKTMGICWVVLILSGLVVSSRLSRSPWLWRGVGVFIVVGWITINTVLLTQSRILRPASEIFTNYRNETGWSSRPYVYLIGWVLTCVASGMEACAHIAEDTKDPARTVPLAMFWSTCASYLMGWISICVLLATTRPDGADERLQPFVSLLSNTIPRPYTTLILGIIVLSMVFQNLAQLFATSRLIWALARESAIPFSQFFHKISPTYQQPLHSIWIVVAIAAPSLLLLGISTQIVGTILLEGAGWSAMVTYAAPIVIYLLCPKDALVGDGRAQWTLRGWSRPMAWIAASFAALFLIVLCFPVGYPVTPLSASYASLVAFCVLLLSTIAWVLYGNARYAGPIKTTTRWTIGAEVELPRRSTTFKTSTHASGAETTSAGHGRTAHVFSSFPTLYTNDAPWEEEGGEEGEEEDSSGTTSTGAIERTMEEGRKGREQTRS